MVSVVLREHFEWGDQNAIHQPFSHKSMVIGVNCIWFALGVTVASHLNPPAPNCSSEDPAATRITGLSFPEYICRLLQRNTSHMKPETQKPICHNPAGYVHCMSFYSSRFISIFQSVTHAAEPCSAGTMCSRLRKKELLECYSKIDFV